MDRTILELFQTHTRFVVDVKLLTELFHAGALAEAIVIPVPMSDRWNLVVTKINGEQVPVTLSRSDRVKRYKRVLGAIADAQMMGFSKIELRIEHRRKITDRSAAV